MEEEKDKINLDLNLDFESIIPWNGQQDSGRDVRLKLDRNWQRVVDAFHKLSEFMVEYMDKRYLRKDKEDVAQEIITFLKGIVTDILQSSDFSSGELGSGFVIKNEGDSSYMEIDRLLVRRVAYFVELIIKSLKHVGGTIVLTPASMRCSRVEEFEAFYRCFFENERDGKMINQEFVAGDQARSQTFNVKEGVSHNVSSQFYWRLVIAVGEDYIDLSKSDAAAGSMPPLAGDDIVQLGNRDDETRQNAIILSTIGDDAPSIKQYKGINSYSTEGKEITIISSVLNSFTGRFRSSVTGEDFDATFDQFKTEMSKIKSQTDKEYTIWFYNYTPTLQNEPASGWSDADKIDHEYDIFYYPDEGLAWRFLEGNWKPITDQQTLIALEKAAKAQDTADGKRRNFVDVPVPPYDMGDTWSNAYYGTLYTNDNLVCVKPKAQGEAFSIDDWQPSSDMNSATKKIFESLIEQLDSKITLQVTAYDELKTNVTDLGIRMDGVEEQINIYATKTNTLEGSVTQLGLGLNAAEGRISAIASLFDEDGHLKEGSGWALASDFASLYTKVYDMNGELAAKAEISTSVQYNPKTGAVTSNIKLTADKISLEAATTINGTFSIDTEGFMTCIGGTIGGFTISSTNLVSSSNGSSLTLSAGGISFGDGKCVVHVGTTSAVAASGLDLTPMLVSVSRSISSGLNLGACFSITGASVSDIAAVNGNVAIYLESGHIASFRMKQRRVSSSQTLKKFDNSIVCVNTSKITLTLPSGCEDGTEMWMFSANGNEVAVSTSGADTILPSSGTSFHYQRWQLYRYDSVYKVWYHSFLNS